MTLSLSDESPSPIESNKSELAETALIPAPPHHRRNDEVPFLASFIEFPEAYQLQIITNLVHNIPKVGTTTDILVIAHWLSFLPGYFGKSKALDAAMTCFTTQQIGTACDDEQMLRYGRSSYVQALVQLQKALNNPEEAVKSETQCAAMLLCIYEVNSSTLSRVQIQADPQYSYSPVPPRSIRGRNMPRALLDSCSFAALASSTMSSTIQCW
jgi:hypothetical protein